MCVRACEGLPVPVCACMYVCQSVRACLRLCGGCLCLCVRPCSLLDRPDRCPVGQARVGALLFSTPPMHGKHLCRHPSRISSHTLAQAQALAQALALALALALAQALAHTHAQTQTQTQTQTQAHIYTYILTEQPAASSMRA
jgi:hypothetical protein